MKKMFIRLMFIAFLMQLTVTGLFAQEKDLFSMLGNKASDDQKSQLNRAKQMVKDADNQMRSVSDLDKKTEKFFKKKKQKKAEKKSVPGKEMRIKSSLLYEKGYSLAYDVYKNFLSTTEFEFADDSQQAATLAENAETEFNDAKSKLEPYRQTEKDELKETKYQSIKSDLNNSKQLYQSAVGKLGEAIELLLKQDEKKAQTEKADLEAWEKATELNTRNSYETYMSSFPSGKYYPNAEAKLAELSAIERKRLDELAQKNQKTSGIYYIVQVAASKTQMDNAKLAKIWPNTGEVEMRQDEGYYKYSLKKQYLHYKEAKAQIPGISVEGAFVTAFKDGKQIPVLDAQKLEDGANAPKGNKK